MINVDRHVGQYVARIFELTNEVERLKKRLEDTTKEAMDKLSKQINQRDASLKDGQRRLKAAYENSKDLRDTRIRDYKNLRLIDRRIALVGAWQVAFDDVFASADPEILPKSLFAIRSEAEKVLSDLENNRLGLNYRLAGTSPDREVEKTLEVTVRNLKAIEGYTEQDVDTLHKDASLYKIMIDRDLFHSMAEADIDATTSVQTLSRALFQSIAVLSQIDIQDESSIEATHKTLFETIQTCTDATSHIIKPNGERVSTMEYPTMSFESPRKKKHVMMDPSSPIRGPFAQPVNGEAPYRPSPRAFKVGTPKKAIQFKKKSPRKKRVRWQDETETEDLVEEESKRSRFETFVAEPPAPSQSIFSDYAPARQPLEHPADLPPLDIPPVRPRNNRMQMGFLSKDGQTSPQKNSNNNQYLHTERRAFSGSTLSPLREHQMSDLLNQQPKEHDHDESSADEHIGKPWQVNLNPKSSMKSRRVSSGSGPPQRPRRRMPSLSGNHMAPDNHMATFRPGHARRMILSKSEKENGVSVLSPKATALKSAPRRITLSGPGGRRMSSAAVFERAAIKTAGRESIAGGSKPTWR